MHDSGSNLPNLAIYATWEIFRQVTTCRYDTSLGMQMLELALRFLPEKCPILVADLKPVSPRQANGKNRFLPAGYIAWLQWRHVGFPVTTKYIPRCLHYQSCSRVCGPAATET